MKALSIKELYVSNIIAGDKEIEYRSWKTDYRGDILICTSLTMEPGFGFIKKYMPVGYATVVIELYDITFDENEKIYNWHIRNPRIIKPIPVKGKLHLFDIDDKLIEFKPEYDYTNVYEYWRECKCMKDTSLTEQELCDLIDSEP